MNVYKSKKSLLAGTSYEEVLKLARKEYSHIEKMTKRQPYVRSTYFNKDKVFLVMFWNHIMQKNFKTRTKRLKFYSASIDLMRNTRHDPETIFSKKDTSLLLHRFYGITKDGQEFCVQIKQNKRTGRKDFMSVFDRKKP